MGTLVPVMIHECVPGDRYKINTQGFVRFAPLRTPVMHRFNVTFHTWFVPHRVVWPEFNDWIYDPSSSLVAPFMTTSVWSAGGEIGSLVDYFGLPVHRSLAGPLKVNALPFAAYQAIYHERYRDQNLCSEFNWKLTSGSNNVNNVNLFQLRNRSFEHDYFTSALPFAQRGPGVDIPIVLTGNAGVYVANEAPAPGGQNTVLDGIPLDAEVRQRNRSSDSVELNHFFTDFDAPNSIQSESSIRDLRRAFRLEEWLELSARAGMRPREAGTAFFNVDPGDARVNDPEYICGAKTPIVIEEIPNTAGEIDGLPQGNLAGKATGLGDSSTGYYFCREHGTMITVMNIQPVSSYMDGVDRFLTQRDDQFKYFWRHFENIGEQEILSSELYADGSPSDNSTFGYIPRYSEYKFKPSRTSGEFRTSLAEWHFARRFSSRPVLSQSFIEAKEGVNGSIRTDPFAVTDTSVEKCYVQVMNNLMSSRPMQYYSNPRM